MVRFPLRNNEEPGGQNLANVSKEETHRLAKKFFVQFFPLFCQKKCVMVSNHWFESILDSEYHLKSVDPHYSNIDGGKKQLLSLMLKIP